MAGDDEKSNDWNSAVSEKATEKMEEKNYGCLLNYSFAQKVQRRPVPNANGVLFRNSNDTVCVFYSSYKAV